VKKQVFSFLFFAIGYFRRNLKKSHTYCAKIDPNGLLHTQKAVFAVLFAVSDPKLCGDFERDRAEGKRRRFD